MCAIEKQVLCSAAKLSGVQPLEHMDPSSQNLRRTGGRRWENEIGSQIAFAKQMIPLA